MKVINNSIWKGIQVAVKINMRHSGVARMCRLRGHSMGTLSV